jgi:uncharacterized NAD(P)/FAD-binding protein YdhS
MARRTVAVVGGGCAGVLVTRELLGGGDDEVVLVEPGELGGGVAYGAAQPWHLLNSRAAAMSADADDPGHFVRWARARDALVGPDDFLGRREYGDYLREVLSEAAAAHPGRLTHRPVTATALHRREAAGATSWRVSTADGDVIDTDHVVLAVGNPRGARPPAVPVTLQDHPGYVADPWRAGALAALPGDASVLLIGTGLTAVDVALTLTADGSRSVPVTAASRRGQLPLGHTVEAAPPSAPSLDDCATLRDVVRAVRASAGAAGDWRAVVDGLRPYLDQLWVALTPAEQDAFLRHLARPWECHRHRMAPSVATRIAALRADGALLVRAGGIRSVAAAADGGLAVQFAAGDGAEHRFAAVVNCAGPGRLPAAAGPLVGALLAAGIARVGPHCLGLDIDAGGRVIAADGAPQPGLWLVGPLRRGARWETTAVPEIRAQARRLAVDLAAEHSAGALLEAA